MLRLFAGMDERLQSRIDRLEEKVDLARLDIASLKVKAAVGGGVAGAVLAFLVALAGKLLDVG